MGSCSVIRLGRNHATGSAQYLFQPSISLLDCPIASPCSIVKIYLVPQLPPFPYSDQVQRVVHLSIRLIDGRTARQRQGLKVAEHFQKLGHQGLEEKLVLEELDVD